jgi:hypothetical protein
MVCSVLNLARDTPSNIVVGGGGEGAGSIDADSNAVWLAA